MEGKELEQRVDLQKLRARLAVERFPVHRLKRLGEDAVGAAVAVVHRVGEQPAVFVEQAEIDAPGVEGDAVEISRLLDPYPNLAHQLAEIPTEMAVPFGGVVLKAVQLLPGERAVIVNAADGAAARAAKVEREHGCFALHLTTPFFRRMFA